MKTLFHSFCQYEGLTEYVFFLFLSFRDSDLDLQSLILLCFIQYYLAKVFLKNTVLSLTFKNQAFTRPVTKLKICFEISHSSVFIRLKYSVHNLFRIN